MLLRTLPSNAGWVTLEAEPFKLEDEKTEFGSSFETKLFIGMIEHHHIAKHEAELAWLSVTDGPAGQVEAGNGSVNAPELFRWVPHALSNAEIDPNTALLDRDVLWCRGAGYHDDNVFNKIFCVLHLGGASGDLVFPRLKVRISMEAGVYVIFDCREPHAFLQSGATEFIEQDYTDSQKTYFAAQDLDPNEDSVSYFFPADKRRPVPSRAYIVDSQNGKYLAR